MIRQLPVKGADFVIKQEVVMSEKLKSEKEVLLQVSTKGVTRYIVVKEQ